MITGLQNSFLLGFKTDVMTWFKLTGRSWLLWYLLQVDIACVEFCGPCGVVTSTENISKKRNNFLKIGINSNLNTKSLSLVAIASKLWTISRPVTPLPKICNRDMTKGPKGMLSALYFDKKYFNMIFIYQNGLKNWISFKKIQLTLWKNAIRGLRWIKTKGHVAHKSVHMRYTRAAVCSNKGSVCSFSM